MLISPYPDQEGSKLIFLSEWREIFSAPCLAGKNPDDSSRLDVVEIARVPDMLPSLFPSRSGSTYQHPGTVYVLLHIILEFHGDFIVSDCLCCGVVLCHFVALEKVLINITDTILQ